MISFVVTAKLICAYVFAYAKCWISQDVAQISSLRLVSVCIRADLLSHIMRKPDFCICKNKAADHELHSYAKLIRAIVFATKIVQSLYFLNPHFKPLAISCKFTAWLVSDQVGNQNIGFLMTWLSWLVCVLLSHSLMHIRIRN